MHLKAIHTESHGGKRRNRDRGPEPRTKRFPRPEKALFIDVEEDTSSAANSPDIPDLERTKSDLKMEHNEACSSDETESVTTQSSETDSLSDIDGAEPSSAEKANKEFPKKDKLRKLLEEALTLL